MKKANWLFSAAFLALAAGGSPLFGSETVVLVHGILNKPFMMKPIEKALEKEGYRVINWGYASTEKTIPEYAAELKTALEKEAIRGHIHFVGFSLGSMILRYYLAETPPANAGRFVQIAPPNRGSEWIEKLYTFKAFRWVYGTKAIEQLKAGSEFLKTCRIPKIPFGIIYGGLGNGHGFNPVLPGDDDGSVSVQSALLAEAKDSVRIASEHSLLLLHPDTPKQVAAFLKNGAFEKKPETKEEGGTK